MEQRMSIVTLGVLDLARSKWFYSEVLGWKLADENDQIAFYKVGSTVLALYPNRALANDIDPMIDPDAGSVGGYRGFTLAQNLASRVEVDALFVSLASAEVTILRQPHEVFWGGYSGYFADPDGNPWEVAHNPFWENDEMGRPNLPAALSDSSTSLLDEQWNILDESDTRYGPIPESDVEAARALFEELDRPPTPGEGPLDLSKWL